MADAHWTLMRLDYLDGSLIPSSEVQNGLVTKFEWLSRYDRISYADTSHGAKPRGVSGKL